ncbi:MAG: alpha/beta hydrolase [Pseudonocardia sp.]|uniref:alpha/beta fold hydrolase n=1 Tax=unclassified Pseudonocardia TaxID=2619320 RepID=UPI0008684C98|nr:MULTISPECIES: alpha/beta hydrolase [unclassified Pseudonocardia]MBN9112038.1 alpha/beta hydrolase [Pseudonocardia sp.]ODU26195.1 MAG: alpha/beta hydrolase [Pseudonocardia sp. SCN 72-51]ODV06038.1 MAG: alpha/beta hydrolase [Pseudonocardia sp. SCN 73-27]
MRSLGGRAQRGYVDLPWGQVHYRHGGDAGAPAVLVLHQSPLSSATYEAVIEPLAKRGLRVVAPDTPGFGMSDPTPTTWTIPQYAEAAWTFADAVGLGTVHLLGQHTGAVIAAEAAFQQPGRVDGIVLQGLPLYDDAERVQKKTVYAPPYEPVEDGGHVRVIRDRVKGLYPRLDVAETDRQVVEYLQTGPDYATAYRAVFDHVVDTDRLDTFPVLLLHGADDLVDRMTPQVTAALPHAGLVTIPGGTDFVADEQPEAFADELARYVLRVPAAGGAR